MARRENRVRVTILAMLPLKVNTGGHVRQHACGTCQAIVGIGTLWGSRSTARFLERRPTSPESTSGSDAIGWPSPSRSWEVQGS